MKTVKMKGKNVEDAVKAALEVIGGTREEAEVRVLNEGKSGLLGVLGGEEAEVEVSIKASRLEEAKEVLQTILDKMGFLAVAEGSLDETGRVQLAVNGEDMGRIIGKEGAMLKSLEIVVGSILRNVFNERVFISIDAGGYQDKRIKALERLAADVAEEVEKTGEEKVLPYLEAADRRAIHLYLQSNTNISTYSKGEGKDRRLVVAPKK